MAVSGVVPAIHGSACRGSGNTLQCLVWQWQYVEVTGLAVAIRCGAWCDSGNTLQCLVWQCQYAAVTGEAVAICGSGNAWQYLVW